MKIKCECCKNKFGKWNINKEKLCPYCCTYLSKYKLRFPIGTRVKAISINWNFKEVVSESYWKNRKINDIGKVTGYALGYTDIIMIIENKAVYLDAELEII